MKLVLVLESIHLPVSVLITISPVNLSPVLNVIIPVEIVTQNLTDVPLVQIIPTENLMTTNVHVLTDSSTKVKETVIHVVYSVKPVSVNTNVNIVQVSESIHHIVPVH